LYAKYYTSLLSSLYQETCDHMKNLQIPSFFQISHLDQQSQCGIGGNLTFTMDPFTTKPHTNNNSPGWSYGLFFPIHTESGDLAYKNQGCDIVGGQIWWPNFDCEVNFSACDGLTEILW
ncbi:hypothetical protein DFH28DRAFT_882277, partial [Melampsora americana]